MKSEKGFTLIELLAIIVILAIIAVITVPIILNIIENSKKGAATDSAYGYKDAVNKWYVTELSKPNNENFSLSSSYTVEDGKIIDDSVSNDTGVLIPFSGDKPSSGYLNYSNNTLTSGCLVFGNYAVTFNGNTTSTEKGTCDEPYTYGYLNVSLGTINKLNDSWNNYLRKDTSISTNPVEVCSKFSSGTVCVEENRWDCTLEQINNNYVCNDSDSYIAQKKAEIELKGGTCTYYHSYIGVGDGNVYNLQCSESDGDGQFMISESSSGGYVQSYDDSTEVLCETITDSCYLSS